jgi:hypothetical protein
LKGNVDIGRATFPLSVFILSFMSFAPLSIAKMLVGPSHDNNNKTFYKEQVAIVFPTPIYSFGGEII